MRAATHLLGHAGCFRFRLAVLERLRLVFIYDLHGAEAAESEAAAAVVSIGDAAACTCLARRRLYLHGPRNAARSGYLLLLSILFPSKLSREGYNYTGVA